MSPPLLRCAAYARFSSDLQRATSIDDQLAAVRTYAEAHGWLILPEHTYTDAALSGASLQRPAIQALMAAVARHPRPFEILLVDDSSRVSRDLADAVRFLQELKFAGIRVVYISQHIDSANEQAETLVGVHGLVDGLYLREMAAKIKRGLAGQLDRGFATGSTTFGYRTVPVPDPTGKLVNGSPALLGKRVEIVPDEARTLVLIFELYASGFGISRILDRLHRDGLNGPRGDRWKEGAVKRVLTNEKYRGLLIWGKKTFERRPGTREYVHRPNPREQWRVQERPELRIVSEELWTHVEARRAAIRQALPVGRTLLRGRHAALHSPHLFSGFMKCAVCRGAIVVVTGGRGSPRYGCLNSWRNGRAVCSNRLTIRAKIADVCLLDGLRAELLNPAAVQYITEQLTAALNTQLHDRPRLLAEAQLNRADVARRLDRTVDAIALGEAVAAAVAPRIVEYQAAIARLDAAIVELTEPLAERIAVMPGLVRQHLADLAGLLSETPARLKAEFQRLGLRVTLAPMRLADRALQYQATVETTLPDLVSLSGATIRLRASGVPGRERAAGTRTSADSGQKSGPAVDRLDPPATDRRTPDTLRFQVTLPANHLGPGWRTRAAG